MRCFTILLATACVIAGGCAAAAADNHAPQTFALETYVLRSYNYLDRMVDRNGLPYFNVFATDPVAAAHDYCDFGDLTSRQWQAAVMARRMTGVEARNEKRWAQNALSYIDPKTGLTGIPKTPYLQELGTPTTSR